MKRIILYASLIFAIGVFNACSEDETVVDYDFQVSNLIAEPSEGAITLRWDEPQLSDLFMLKVDFYNIREKKNYVMNKSAYADSLTISGLLARDGDYTFRLTAVNAAGQESSAYSEVKCTCLPVQPTITVTSNEVEATMLDNYATNAQEPSEGPLKDLFDGNNSTFFHTPWSSPTTFPAWVQIEVSQPVNGAKFYTINRGNGSGSPGYVEILGSNDGEIWTKLYEFSGEDIPRTDQGRYDSPLIYNAEAPETHYKFFRYNVTESYGGCGYWNMAEMAWEFYEVTQVVYDPENETD